MLPSAAEWPQVRGGLLRLVTDVTSGRSRRCQGAAVRCRLEGRYPKLNNLGSIAFFETSTKDVWLFESAGQAFTNLSDLPGYPGASPAFDLKAVLALNNDNQISFHSGDRNSGDVYVYDHVAASFLNVSDQAGAPGRARENAINNAGQVCYMGFPDLYVYDMGTGTTTNITDLPGGPGTGLGSLVFNDGGDIAIFKLLTAIFFDSESATFLDLSTLPGFPPGAASTSTNDISNRGELTFWRDGIYYFEPISQTFTRLNGQGSVPGHGTAASINEASEIALAPGPLGAEDIFLAIPTRPLPPTNARIIR